MVEKVEQATEIISQQRRKQRVAATGRELTPGSRRTKRIATSPLQLLENIEKKKKNEEETSEGWKTLSKKPGRKSVVETKSDGKGNESIFPRSKTKIRLKKEAILIKPSEG